MITRPIKKRLLFGMILAVALMPLSLTAWKADMIPFDPIILKVGEVIVVPFDPVIDVRDDRRLVGFADSVFFGQVVEGMGQAGEYSRPQTWFRVKVLEVLKGSAAGEVTVRQEGGWTWYFTQVRMEGDLQLLELGKSYLFVTRIHPEQGWHALVPGYGDIEIQASKFASEEEVLGSQHARELRQRFIAAVEHQIPYDPENRY